MSNYKTVFFTLGVLQIILGISMIIPIVIQIIYGELDSSFIGAGIITIIFGILFFLANLDHDKKLNSILNSSEKWLKNLYMINEIFGEKKDIDENNTYELDMEFDFPSWLSRSHLPLDQFKNHSKYVFNYDFKKN